MKRRKQQDPSRTAAPAALTRAVKIGIPKIMGSPYSGDGRIRVRHREYVAEVAGSVAFAVTSYSINPGLAQLFVWLSSIANQYESYLFKSLKFIFETERSTAISGSVMMAVEFDASEASPINKQQMMSNHNAVRAVAWNEFEYMASSEDLSKFGSKRYTRPGTPSGTVDIKTYDVGNLLVATQGCADTTVLGELYVEYDVELQSPQTDLLGVLNSQCAKIVGGGTISRTAIYGTAAVITGGLPVTASASTLTFNKVGQYLINIDLIGTGTGNDPAVSGTATATFLNRIQNSAQTSDDSEFIVKVNNIGETMILDYSADTTVTASTVRISPYLYSLA